MEATGPSAHPHVSHPRRLSVSFAPAEVRVRSPGHLLCVLRAAFGDPAHAAPADLDLLDGLVADLHRETDPRRIGLG